MTTRNGGVYSRVSSIVLRSEGKMMKWSCWQTEVANFLFPSGFTCVWCLRIPKSNQSCVHHWPLYLSLFLAFEETPNIWPLLKVKWQAFARCLEFTHRVLLLIADQAHYNDYSQIIRSSSCSPIDFQRMIFGFESLWRPFLFCKVWDLAPISIVKQAISKPISWILGVANVQKPEKWCYALMHQPSIGDSISYTISSTTRRRCPLLSKVGL